MDREPTHNRAVPVASSVDDEQPRVRWSLPLFAVGGIQLRVHVTFIALLALVAWAASVPGGPGAFAGIGWLLLLFACVAAHEFAHALVARRRGVDVHEILLLPIGGVSKLESMPERWNDELAIAIVGPLASLALAAGSLAAALLLGEALYPVDLLTGSIVVRLAWVNAILATFNLLPAFPLDGGRVLRALLERRHDLETATRWSARIGRVLAVTMMIVGAFLDWWLVIIGAFVYFGASAEEQATLMHVRLAPLHVGDLVVEAPVRFEPDARAASVGPVVRHALQPVFPVVHGDEYLGACTGRGILGAAPDARCGTLVDPHIPSIDAEAPVEGAVATLVHEHAETAVVVTNGTVVGLFRLADVGRALENPTSSGPSVARAESLVKADHFGQTSPLRKDSRS